MSTQTALCTSFPFRTEIWIGGVHRTGEVFPSSSYKEAIANYLEKIWSNDVNIMKSPKIYFATFEQGGICGVQWNHVVLELDRDFGVYHNYYLGTSPAKVEIPALKTEEIIQVCHFQPTVEWGLARLTKDPRIKLLAIRFLRSRIFYILKEEQKIVAFGNIPCKNQV